MEKRISFLHSGDMGDLIAGLAAVKQICDINEAKARFIVDTTGGLQNKFVRTQSSGLGLKLGHSAFEFLKPLLELQPYLASVEEWTDKTKHPEVDFDLNMFRSCFFSKELLQKTNQNLLFCHQVVLGLPMGYTGPWLAVPEVENEGFALAARSNRYHSSDQLYLVNRKKLSEGHFIGTDLEYAAFQDCTRIVPKRTEIKNALEAAIEIEKSERFLVNGTLFYWIAVGMGHPKIFHEVGCSIPTTQFELGQPPITYCMGLQAQK